MGFWFKAASDNTGAATINVNSLGAKTMKKNGGADDLDAGDLVSGGIYKGVYDGTNVQITGGVASGGLVQIGDSQVASDDASVDFTTGITDAYDTYMVEFSGVRPATDDVQMFVRAGAGSFDTGSSYSRVGIGVGSGAVVRTHGSAADTEIELNLNTGAIGMGNAATESGGGRIFIHNPANTTLHKTFRWEINYKNGSGDAEYMAGAGSWDSASAMDRIQFFMSSGNVAEGRFTLYGVRHG
jgi:hypothetical protein